MKIPAKYFLMISVFLAVITLIGTIIQRLETPHQDPEQQNNTQNIVPLSSNSKLQSGFTIKNVVLKEFEKSKAYEVIVNAEECRYFQINNLIECLQVTCTLLNQNNETAHIKTDHAMINQAAQNILLGGTVTCKFKDILLTGMDITYNYSQQTLLTTKNAHYQHPAFSITAQESFVDIKNNKFILSGNVINEFLYSPTSNNSR